MPQLKVIDSGLYSSIQDMGRFGVAHLGIPKSGVMDQYSYRYANTLLQNEMDASVIEMTLKGGRFEFPEPTQIAVSGASTSVKLNGQAVPQYQLLQVNPKDILQIGLAKAGFRIYLAIKGGFQTEKVFESYSQYAPITKSGKLKKGDLLSYKGFKNSNISRHATVKFKTHYFSENDLQCFKGQEFDELSEQQQKLLIFQNFSIDSMSNRMAYQVEESLQNDLEPIITSPVLPGTVQLTPNGNLIVLMQDCQTTGGYPRVLQLSDKALQVLSQKRFGEIVNFRLIDF